MKKRLKPEVRKAQILDAAMRVAERGHYSHSTREEIANEAGVAVGLVTNYFGTMPQLKRSIMRHAVTTGNVSIVAQGLGMADPQAKKAPQELKEKALKFLAS